MAWLDVRFKSTTSKVISSIFGLLAFWIIAFGQPGKFVSGVWLIATAIPVATYDALYQGFNCGWASEVENYRTCDR